MVQTYIRTGEPLNCVNIDARPKCDQVLSIRHTGVLTNIIQYLSENNAEILSLNNQLLTGGGSQTCSVRIKCKNINDFKLDSIDGVLSAVSSSE